MRYQTRSNKHTRSGHSNAVQDQPYQRRLVGFSFSRYFPPVSLHEFDLNLWYTLVFGICENYLGFHDAFSSAEVYGNKISFA
jgi:hypothetical protein